MRKMQIYVTYNVALEGNQEKDEILTSLETLNLKINTKYEKYYHLVKTNIYNLRKKRHFACPILKFLFSIFTKI